VPSEKYSSTGPQNTSPINLNPGSQIVYSYIPYMVEHGLLKYINTKAKCRHLKKLPVKDVYLSEAVMGKHPDLMVAHPTSTIFPTIGRNFEIS
jgi:hypothetical protein